MVENLEIDKEFIENLKARDSRWKAVETAIQVDAELTHSIVVKYILQSLQDEAEKALTEIVNAAPGDIAKISSLQVKIKYAKILGNTLEHLRQNGIRAQLALEDEGRIDSESNEEFI